MTVPVITVDGPVSSGKGTVARRLAHQLDWRLLDSGALYRVAGYYAVSQDIDLSDEKALVPLVRSLPVVFREQGEETQVLLDGKDVSRTIRQESVGDMASRVAILPGVRTALLDRQRRFAQPPGLVADGRDMGTVVFPDAPLKVFLTASPEERARRRYNQLKEKGFSANLAALVEDIRTRDERDSQRPVAPLVPAPDAVVIDSTDMTVDEVLSRILKEASGKHLV